MRNSMKLGFLGAFSLAMVVAACGDDETTATGPTGPGATATSSSSASSTGVGAGGGGGMGNPPMPTLGAEMDRMGRPAINTALNMWHQDDATRGAAEDTWNEDGNMSTWAATFGPDVRAGLAVMDSLDTNCGNQLAFDALGNGDDYNSLAVILSVDALIIKGDAAAGCATYLGVEANFLGITNDDCGGRTPVYDVIETTYSAVALGTTTGFDDRIAVPQRNTDAMAAGFPYLPPTN